MSEPLTPDQGLLSPEEEELLRRVEGSQVWQLIRDALCLERETLFAGTSSVSGLAGQPTTTETLWVNRGAILLIQHLLQEGPRLVVWYTRYMDEQAKKQTAKSATKRPEREYSSRPELNGRPDEFDL